MGRSPYEEAISFWMAANDMAKELKALLIIEEGLKKAGVCEECLTRVSSKRQKAEEELRDYLKDSSYKEEALRKAREFGFCWGEAGYLGETITLTKLEKVIM